MLSVGERLTVNDSDKPLEDRSVHIGGNAAGNIIQTGDRNTATWHVQQAYLPPPESVDIQAELSALRELLSRLETPDGKKINNALEEAGDEAAKDKPDKDEIGKALDRALGYARKSNDFAQLMANLAPHVTKAAAWLGDNWHKLLAVVGLAV